MPRTTKPDAGTHRSAYVAALTMLSRRELSESQIRQRLARRQYEDDEIDEAVARLKEERAIDDARVAAAIARTQTSIKKRGKLRVTRHIQQAGIASGTAKRATDEVFADLDDEALLEAALAKRLRGRERAADDRELQRLYRFLIAQGFEPDSISRALRTRRPKPEV
jgi:regulatory protein